MMFLQLQIFCCGFWFSFYLLLVYFDFLPLGFHFILNKRTFSLIHGVSCNLLVTNATKFSRLTILLGLSDCLLHSILCQNIIKLCCDHQWYGSVSSQAANGVCVTEIRGFNSVFDVDPGIQALLEFESIIVLNTTQLLLLCFVYKQHIRNLHKHLSPELLLILMKIRLLKRLSGAALMEPQSESPGKEQLPWRHT